MLRTYYKKGLLEAGCDEAGRGSLAGPVYAAAVILEKGTYIRGLNDSKLVIPEKRLYLRKQIENKALAWAVGRVDVEEIDRLNILRAAIKAMHLALDKLFPRPESILVDGNFFVPYYNMPHYTIIQGDSQYASIAAASILAKTYRDEHMVKLHREYPQYGWQNNKGYATEEHRMAIIENGSCAYHRKSFRIKRSQLEISWETENGQL